MLNESIKQIEIFKTQGASKIKKLEIENKTLIQAVANFGWLALLMIFLLFIAIALNDLLAFLKNNYWNMPVNKKRNKIIPLA